MGCKGLVSFVVAAHNEIESLPLLLDEIRAAARSLPWRHEIVVVDDGSTDGSAAWLRDEAVSRPDIRPVYLARNRGQSAAMAIGLHASRGEIVVTLDADLQNNAADAALLLAALESADLACGVRVGRQDRFAKLIGSRIANRFRRWVLHDVYHDVGCTLKAWRRPVARAIPKFRGFHRFIPVLAEREGFRVVEVEVSHRPRRFGETHYGNLRRGLEGLRDLFGVAWLLRRHLDLPEKVGAGSVDRAGKA